MKSVLLSIALVFGMASIANAQHVYHRPGCEVHTPRTHSHAYHSRHYVRFQYVPQAPPVYIQPYYSPLYTPSYTPLNYYGNPYGYYQYRPAPSIVFGIRF